MGNLVGFVSGLFLLFFVAQKKSYDVLFLEPCKQNGLLAYRTLYPLVLGLRGSIVPGTYGGFTLFLSEKHIMLQFPSQFATLSSRQDGMCLFTIWKMLMSAFVSFYPFSSLLNIFVDFIYKIGWKAVCTNRSFKQGLQPTVDKNRNTIIWIEHIKESLPVRLWFEASVGIQCKHSQMNGTTQWCAITIHSHKRAYFNYSSISKVQRKITWSHLMHTCVIIFSVRSNANCFVRVVSHLFQCLLTLFFTTNCKCCH